MIEQDEVSVTKLCNTNLLLCAPANLPVRCTKAGGTLMASQEGIMFNTILVVCIGFF